MPLSVWQTLPQSAMQLGGLQTENSRQLNDACLTPLVVLSLPLATKIDIFSMEVGVSYIFTYYVIILYWHWDLITRQQKR